MPLSPGPAIAAFARRVAFGGFVAGCARSAFVVGVAAAAVLVVARLAGHTAAPHWSWSFAALPVLAAGGWQWRRQRLPLAIAAQHLDRRVHADGLLLTAAEGVALAPEWHDLLQQRLAAVPQALPQPQWGELLPRPLLALGLAALVAWLPAGAVPPLAPASFTGLAALERLDEQLRTLLQQAVLPGVVAQELAHKLEELQQRVAAGDAQVWREVDELAQRLGREGLLAAAQAGSRGGDGAAGAGEALAQKALAAAAEALLGDGKALDALPRGLVAALQQAMQPGGALDPRQFAQDPAQLRALTQALAGAVEQFTKGGGAAGLSPSQLQKLQDLVGRAGDVGKHLMVRDGQGVANGAGRSGSGAGNGSGAANGNGSGAANGNGAGNGSGAANGPGNGSGMGDGQGGEGQGGLGRGPGYAALRLTEDSQGTADGAMVLPPGTPIPTDWVPIGERIAAPETAPVRNGTAGGAAVGSGSGGATWQLQLAPRHRSVVQRFFTAGSDAAATPREPR